MTTPRRPRSTGRHPRPAPALALAAAALAAAMATAPGCDTARPGLGLTNGPAPTADEVKPAVRTDLPAPTDPDAGAGAAEALRQPTVGTDVTGGLGIHEQGLAGSDIGGTGTEAGLGGRNAGRGGLDPAKTADPEADRDPSEEVRATPPTTELPNAGPPGGTRPGGTIQAGDPRGLRPSTGP